MKNVSWVRSILTVLILLVVPMIGNASVLGFSLEAGLDYRQTMPDPLVFEGLQRSPHDAVADELNRPAETVILNEGSCLSCSSSGYQESDQAETALIGAGSGNVTLPYEIGWQNS